MKIPVSVLALALAASIPLAGCTQQASAADGQPPSGQRGQMQQAREAAKTAAFNDLSADHRARVQAIVDGVNNGTDTDVRGAVSQIDAILSADESKAVLAERDKLTEAMKANAPAGAPMPPNRPASADAGRFLLQLGVSRERMRALREAMRGNAAAGAPGPGGAPGAPASPQPH